MRRIRYLIACSLDGYIAGRPLGLGQVDTVEVAMIPVLLGGGTPLVPAPAERHALSLTGHRVYGTGIVPLEYAMQREPARKPRSRRRRRGAAEPGGRSGVAPVAAATPPRRAAGSLETG